jgi:aspartate 1-decarboxylase
MRRIMLKSKVHRARVTEIDLHYEGSLSLDEDLMAAADMLPFEKVHVYNVSNGERFSTYLIKAEKGSGQVGVFGAAAQRVKVGDTVIIVSYVILDEEESGWFAPKIVLLGPGNKVIQIK